MPLVRLSAVLPKPIYYNSISSAHLDFNLISSISATGGIYTTIGDYIIHTFTANDTLNVITGGAIDVLVVGGGGAGGATMGGGGGAGGVIYQSNVHISAGSYPITIGNGGTAVAGTGNNGQNSTFNGLTAIGGGGGGAGVSLAASYGVNGGSGGGGSLYSTTATGGTGVTGQGNAGAIGDGQYNTGGCGGGGGGGGAAGSTGTKAVSGGKGGDGLISTISGVSSYYGGGGGGGGNNYSACPAGGGGLGGGGAGGRNVAGTAGTANTGGGGGGGGYNGTTGDRWGGAGGSGIVIVRYKKSYNTTPVPLTISGCQYWFDASNGPLTSGGSIPSNGGSISTWTDRSGNNRNAIVGTPPTYITNVLNGNPVVRFTSSQYLTHSGYSPGSIAMTYVLVERNLSGSTGAAPISWGSTSSRNSGIIFQNNSGMQPFSNSQAFNNTTGRYWIYRQNNTGSGDNGIVNGVSVSPTSNDTGNINGPFDIGRRNVSNIYCSGDIAEIIVYNRAITNTERTTLSSYLSQKYNL